MNWAWGREEDYVFFFYFSIYTGRCMHFWKYNIINCFSTLTYCSKKMSLYLLHFSDLQSNAFSMLQA